MGSSDGSPKYPLNISCHGDAYFQGEVIIGKRHGHGQMWYSDGTFYEGTWKNDKRHGLGLFVEGKLTPLTN